MEQKTPQLSKLKKYNISYQLVLLYRIAVVMVLFSISRLGFFYFNSEHYTDMTFSRFMIIMLGGLKFDISGVLYVNALYILLYLLPFPFRTKSGYQQFLKYLFFITNSIALATNVGDFFYFDFILKRSTADVFMFAGEQNMFTLLQLFFVDYFVGVLFFIMLVVLLVYGYRKIKLQPIKTKKTASFYISAIIWLLVSAYFTVIGMRGGFTGTTRPITLGNAGVFTQKPLEMSIVLNTPFCLIRTLDKAPLKEKHYFTDNELAQVYTPVHIHKQDSTKSFKPLNVVILIMESFAKEYVGAYNKNLDNGTYEGYTPFLDSLISQSQCFQYSFANGRKSIDAMPSIIAGIPSVLNPYVTSVYASNEINGLAHLLKNKGYETGFFHGAPNGSMGFDAFAKVAGYDSYFGMTEYDNDDDFNGSWGIWDEEFFQFMADKLNDFKEPFQATLFSLSSHHPFKIPERYEGKFKKGPLKHHIPVQYSDMSLRKFFQKISKAPWFNNTLFVITADHSSEAFHPEYKTPVGDFSIPIIFYQPNNRDLRGMDSLTIAQQTDIMPTILNYLNYDEDFVAFGCDLFDDTAPKFAFNYKNSTYQIIEGAYSLLFRQDNPDVEEKMLSRLKAFIQQYNYRMIHNELIVN